MLDKNYENLQLTDAYLTDTLLMALAWKKSHDYIRSTSWYADQFELDMSSLNLAIMCDEWTESIQKGVLSFQALQLVPAPKSQEWLFTEVKNSFESESSPFCVMWEPKESEKLQLRPLAHIGIREQSIMTLVMMCLANLVEAKQGDPATKYEEVHDKKVVSYGNRLYCTYKDGKAEHSYGATTTYSKYFVDYRTFLKRSSYFASKALPEKGLDEEIYLVELDLRRFFDQVNREQLNKKIKSLITGSDYASESKKIVYKVLKAFEKWEWSSASIKNYKNLICDDKEEPLLGLPQGLVAGGFLANIYMLDFDSDIRESVGDYLPCSLGDDQKIKLVDYCRYVDDMRLVLVGPSRNKDTFPTPIKTIKEKLENWLQEPLRKLGLELNRTKTKVEVFRGKAAGISKQLEDIQTKASGPMSYEDAEEQLSQLESLLLLSPSSTPVQDGNGCKINRLAVIEKDTFDVREDTMRRFAANKISSMLSNIRHFSARAVDESGEPLPGSWDYLQERLARRLIACWSQDPALTLLLKKGLDLFPSRKLLDPVMQQLEYLLDKKFDPSIKESVRKETESSVKRQNAIARYTLAEIFRHSAGVIHRKNPDAIPAHADIEAYFEALQNKAAQLITQAEVENIDKPSGDFDFLSDQARFLLLVRLDTLLEKNTGNPKQDLIFKLAKGFREITLTACDSQSIATCVLIASQLVTDLRPLIRAVSGLLEQKNVCEHEVLSSIAIQDGELAKQLILFAQPLGFSWVMAVKVQEIAKKLYINIRPSEQVLGSIKEPIGLFQLISRSENPFANEIMALKLMQTLISKASEFKQPEKVEKDEIEVIDLARTKVKFSEGYSLPPRFSDFGSDLTIEGEVNFHKPLAEIAKHLKSQDPDTAKLQKIALCIRAVLAGTSDATGFGQVVSPKAGYRGLKSTQYKRQLGLYTTPDSLGGDTAEFSSWLTTLLAKLLRWPGIRVNDQGYSWPRVLTLEAVEQLITERLELLKVNYCQLSGMPSLPERISPSWDKQKSSLTVAMVQSKLPYKDDFAQYGKFLDDPNYRTKHRRHIARVASLVMRHIEAQHIEKPNNGEREQDIDLIVWPELAVHKDDMDILIQLSRKTHAIIFAGLGFIQQDGIKGPNNCAVWIVPRKHNGNQNEIKRYQGKHHMMADEKKASIEPWRPYQLMLELVHPKYPSEKGFVMTGAVCFDATDIKLSADLTDKSNCLLIPALNRDVNTFDTMVEALHYHIYQPVVLVNTGEFGGSYAMAPYQERHKRLIAHNAGNEQVAINTFSMNMFDFRRDGVGKELQSDIKKKAAPAGLIIV